MKFLTLIVLVACTQPAVPYVQIVTTQELKEPTINAVNIWGELGFEGNTVPSALPECEAPWTDGHVDCQMTFVIHPEPGLYNEDSGDGHLVGVIDRDTRIVRIDTNYLHGDHLLHTLAHELGHALLNCYHLNDKKQVGIMNAKASWLLVPTQDDYDLACEKVGLCYNSVPPS